MLTGKEFGQHGVVRRFTGARAYENDVVGRRDFTQRVFALGVAPHEQPIAGARLKKQGRQRRPLTVGQNQRDIELAVRKRIRIAHFTLVVQKRA